MIFPFHRKKPLLAPAEQEQVVACIKEAEAKTTGELRVFVESKCSYMDAIDRAWELFHNLGMSATERRNAVLVYLAIEDRQFAIVGDKEIYEKAGGPAFWEKAAEKLRGHLKNGEVGSGLANCVKELGNAMATHFPHDPTITKNELPDEIVFGK
ncbi:MAG: TPM domain-containing protein [Bacteroidetes bacterium]|nr:TPM domain-containing protein [Bacteroidota bacterium]